jgi:hypothetical protein
MPGQRVTAKNLADWHHRSQALLAAIMYHSLTAGLEAADDGGLTAAGVLDGRIDDWSVMSCRRLTVLG